MTLHDSTSKELHYSCFLDERFEAFVRKSLDNVLLSRTFSDSLSRATAWISSNNTCIYTTRACTQCVPGPTHSSVCHSLLFPFSVCIWSIGLCIPFQLCFLYRGSFARRRITKCILSIQGVANPNNSTRKIVYKKLFILNERLYKTHPRKSLIVIMS